MDDACDLASLSRKRSRGQMEMGSAEMQCLVIKQVCREGLQEAAGMATRSLSDVERRKVGHHDGLRRTEGVVAANGEWRAAAVQLSACHKMRVEGARTADVRCASGDGRGTGSKCAAVPMGCEMRRSTATRQRKVHVVHVRSTRSRVGVT